MLGGVFWSLGNILAIPIIKRLGLALGLLIWNATSTLFGWVIGTWGGFGIHARPASMMWLSYLGMVLIFVSWTMFMFVKNKPPYENEEATYKVYEESDGHFKKVPIDTADVESVIETCEWKGSFNGDTKMSCLNKSDKAVYVFN
uniref:Uncharacterized protein n=1 Tax=Panagrolaimus davidi TaxID=227884 RepID=A0A914QIU7_9BILA